MKLPALAKRVFEWILFDVYQWPQELFDGTITTFEMLKRKPTVDVIVVDGNLILVTEEEQPNTWAFPAIVWGGSEEWEDVIQAGKRELLEETWYEAKKWELLAEYFWVSSKLHYHETLLIARDITKIQDPILDGWEKISIRWVNFDEFLQLARNPKFSLPLEFKFAMYEALVDSVKYEELKKTLCQ